MKRKIELRRKKSDEKRIYGKKQKLRGFEETYRFEKNVLRQIFGICSVRLNLINHVLTLFRDKFACNTAFRNPVFRWESCKGNV